MPGFPGRVWRSPIRRKLVFAEAFANVATAWVLVRLTPYAFWRPTLGKPLPLPMVNLSGVPARRSGNAILTDIAWAHHWLARRFPAHFTCLMLAISARAMLSRRKVASVLVLGAKPGRDAQSRNLAAHAWVVSQGFEIVGGESRDGHIPVAAFSDRSVQDRTPEAGIAE